MKRSLVFAISILALGPTVVLSTTAPSAFGAQLTEIVAAAGQTAIFAIENMTCALCPVTVKKAMEGVPGVRSVQVNFATKTATVVFDSSVTSAEAIAAASTNAGYPATAKR